MTRACMTSETDDCTSVCGDCSLQRQKFRLFGQMHDMGILGAKDLLLSPGHGYCRYAEVSNEIARTDNH